LSYNSRGFSRLKQDFMKFLLFDSCEQGSVIPILCNREDFILKDNAFKIRQAFPSFHILVNPAIKNSLDSGRPGCGMFIAFPDSIKNHVEDISPNFWRVQAAKINFSNMRILLINSYFPTDPQRDYVDDTDLQETISYIKILVNNTDCEGVLLAGDLNGDFMRKSNHCNAVKELLEEINLKLSWDAFNIDFTAVK